jgi:hypothetical protein
MVDNNIRSLVVTKGNNGDGILSGIIKSLISSETYFRSQQLFPSFLGE